MNIVTLIGRLTKDPQVNYTQGENPMCIAKYTLAVERRSKKGGEQNADFISCVAFGKNGEFAEKYFKKGTKIAVVGHITTGSYTNKEGQKVYTTDVVIDSQEFAESKNASQNQGQDNATLNTTSNTPLTLDGFMAIPDGIDEQLPFS